jgi:putative spermidine/putrescine transport system substrate-binding protein
MTRTRFIAAATVLTIVATACGGDDDDDSGGESATTASGATASGATGGALADAYRELCPPEDAPDTMVLAIWGGKQTDLVLTGLQEFMDAVGTNVESTGDGTGDRLAKMRAEVGGQSIDVALVPVNEVPGLLEEDVIIEHDTNIPNYENLVEEAKVDGGYGTSLLAGVIAYNPEFVPEPPTSWTGLLDEQYKGHVAWSNLPGANGYAELAMIAKSMGGSEEDLSPAIERVSEFAQDGGIATITDFGPSVQPLVETGDVWIYAEISGQIQALIENELPLEITVPEEGSPAMMNVAVIPNGVRNEGCSKALVSALLSPAVQQRYIEGYFYHPTVSNVPIPPILADRVYPRPGDDLVELDWAAISANAEEYIDQFNREVVAQ